MTEFIESPQHTVRSLLFLTMLLKDDSKDNKDCMIRQLDQCKRMMQSNPKSYETQSRQKNNSESLFDKVFLMFYGTVEPKILLDEAYRWLQ